MDTVDRVSRSIELIEESVAQRLCFNTVDYTNQNVSDFLGYQDANARIAVPAQGGFLTQLNRQQPACISNWAVLGLDKPTYEFKPRQTGEPPLYYFNPSRGLAQTPAVTTMMKTIPTEAYKPDEDGNVQPLEEGIALAVKSTIQASQAAAQQAKMLGSQMGAASIPIPQALPDDLLIEINDQTATDAFKDIFDILWAECGADYFVRENILYTIVQGVQHLAYEWNEDQHRYNIWNPPWLMVHLDPNCTDISRAEWAIMDVLMSADKCKSQAAPEYAQLIEDNSSRSPALSGSQGVIFPAFYRNNNYRRNMVIRRTMWERYQPFPMDAQEAIDKGHVVPGQPDQSLLGRIGSGLRGMLGMGGSDEVSESDQTNGSTYPDAAAEGQENAGGVAEAQPPTVLRHAKTKAIVGSITADGTPVGNTKHADWPVRYGIRQTTIITNGQGGAQLESRECEFSDIPLPHNVNIPIMQSPQGQGEPTRMRSMQRFVNDLVTNLNACACNNAFPVQLIRRSTYESLGQKDLQMAHTSPGKVLVVDDDVADKYGLDKTFINVAAMAVPESLVKLLQIALSMLDKESNLQDAPNMEGSPWSGQALEQAAAPNKGAATMKGMRIEQMLQYLAKLIFGDITSPVRLSAQQLHEMCPKYPVQVWEAMQTRHKRLIVDITCEITNGSGVSKNKKQQDVLAQFNDGTGPMGQFSAQTLEDLGHDTEALVTKQNAFDQMRSASQQQSQPAGAAVAPNGQPPAPQQQVTAAPQGPPQTNAA